MDNITVACFLTHSVHSLFIVFLQSEVSTLLEIGMKRPLKEFEEEK